MKKNGFWQKIFKYAGTYRKNLLIAVLFSLLTGVAVAVQPLIIKDVIDKGIQNTALEPAKRLETVFLFFTLILHKKEDAKVHRLLTPSNLLYFVFTDLLLLHDE